MDDEGVFSVRLRALREAAGLTQDELAERAGLSGKAISLLERGERRRPYPHTVAALAEALGLEGDRREALTAAARRPAQASTGRVKGSLPVPPTPLVGRAAEVGEIGRLLVQPGTRLVTLTGTGGVGKTRLALAVLESVAARFEDGAAFVGLASIAEPNLVMPTVLRILGVKESGRDPQEALRSYLARRRLLLVLDNVEHVLDAAPAVAAVLGHSDGPVVLATSRAPLRIRGEVEYPVAPLWAPETVSPSVEAVQGSPAGRLFVDRARAASPTFELTEANAADVAAICRGLAGLPLALEIAAARSRLVGPRQMLARLDRALHDEGARDLPQRHRTLRRALDWSHDLLEERDKALFERLAVFAGGFTLEAAEAVGAGLPGSGEALDALGHLVDQSLVVAEPSGTDGTLRYRMLEPVRQYAAERLAADSDEEAARLEHARHFLALAEEASPHTEASEQIEWLDLLAVENDNLQAAITWSVDSGRVEMAVRFAWALRMYWLMRDRREEGRRLVERVAPDDDRLSEELRGRLLHVLAFCHYGYHGPQRRLAEQAVELFRRLDHERGVEYALGQLGFAHLVAGDVDAATTALRQALDLATRYRDEAHAAHCLNHLAVVPLRGGDTQRAAELAGRALALTARTGERLAKQTSLQILAQSAWSEGDHARAREHFRGSLRVATELSDPVNVGYCLRGLAVSDGADGASTGAARLLGAADTLLEGAGYPLFAWAVGQIDIAVTAAEDSGADDAAWAAAYEDGRTADVEDVVTAALEPE